METKNPYFEKTLKSARTFFSRWKGSSGEMCELTSSHKTLRIVIRNDKKSGSNLLVACIDPYLIRGPVRWPNCDLRAETTVLVQGGETLFRVVDDLACVEIICGGLEVKENVKI
jgi:hypothetical protein